MGAEAQAVMMGISLLQGQKSISNQKKMSAAALAEQKAARESLEKRIAKYEKSEFVPLDVDALKEENLFEEMDMTQDVLPAADFAKEQFAQQQANILGGLRGIAGGSGIAGLAQSLSMQAREQAKEQAVNLGTILSQNRKAAIAAQQQIKANERSIKLANMEGRNAFELDKMATLMGVSGQRAYAAGQAAAQAQSNYLAMQSQQQQLAMQSYQYMSKMDWGTGDD